MQEKKLSGTSITLSVLIYINWFNYFPVLWHHNIYKALASSPRPQYPIFSLKTKESHAWSSENHCLQTLYYSAKQNKLLKVKNDHRSKFSNLSNWKEEAWKNQGFNGIRTRDLREYRCDALPTELWSHTLGARSFFTFIYYRSSNMNYFIYTSNHFTLHGKIWTKLIDLAPNVWLHSSVGRASHRYLRWSRVRILLKPWFFQASSFQLLELENLLRWSFFTFIYHHSSSMNYFIYTSHQKKLLSSGRRELENPKLTVQNLLF